MPSASSAVTNEPSLVDWVCARAAANQSLSRCDACQFFPLKQLAPAEVGIRLPAAECSAVRPRIAWFMCLSPAVDAKALKHLEYVKAAIVSARLNAPSLAPYIILVCAGLLHLNFSLATKRDPMQES